MSPRLRSVLVSTFPILDRFGLANYAPILTLRVRVMYKSIRLPVQRARRDRWEREICHDVGTSSFLRVIPDPMPPQVHPTIQRPAR